MAEPLAASERRGLHLHAERLRVEIRCSRQKAQRITFAIQQKEKSLTRLEALIAMQGDDAVARPHNE